MKENDSNFFTDLIALKDSLYVKNRPIVVFPECTKTNGKGILQIEDDIVQILVKAAKNGIHLHTLRFDYEFEYTSPYNTTDISGWKFVAKLLA